MDYAYSHRSLHRFRQGDKCDECNARRWYADSSFHYCERGHLIESFIPFDREDEDNYGGGGHVARRQKEVRQHETRQLTGLAARELFLECLQLLLRRQIAWLQQRQQPVNGEHGDHSEHATILPPAAALESVVRDLWELRVRDFHGLSTVATAASRETSRSRSRSRSRSVSVAPDGGSVRGRASSVAGSESGRTVYSSQQPESDRESSHDPENRRRRGTRKKARSMRKWQSERDDRWNLPAIVETLALCYLGCVLLRLPYRIGDFFQWAKNGQIPFLEAIHYLPMSMRERLPPTYQNALVMRKTNFHGGSLHLTVSYLVRGFYSNHELRFPGLNMPPIVWRWTRTLGLPIEVCVGVQEIVQISQEDFCYPLEQAKLSWLDHPDVFLATCIVFVTKLLFPFRDDEEDSGNAIDETKGDNAGSLQMDWKEWQVITSETLAPTETTRTLQRRDMEKLRSADAWKMTGDQLDDYMNWHQEVRLKETEDHRHILALFPLQDAEILPPAPEESDAAVNERYRRIQKTCLSVAGSSSNRHRHSAARYPTPPALASNNNSSSSSSSSAGRPVQHFRTEADLSEMAHAFYSRAAELGGLTVPILVRSVNKLERRWEEWAKLSRKA